ncbi:MAG: type II toxin-antitoxin system VapC family toxin [Ktedonobacteraceae bacterium]|nr:type II toxin-antitoxin system VapC family toxin [Ktedonobacteraceae bacterium]
MRRGVLDASALLALLNGEAGSEQVASVIVDGAAISAVNLAEVVTKLSEIGMPEALIHDVLDLLGLEIIDFDFKQAYQVGLLRPFTRHAGLSLGDRACLALAQLLDLPALTTDRIWASLAVNVTVLVIR